MKRSNECELAAAPEVQLAGVPLLQRDGACAFGRFLMQHGWSVLPLGSTEAKTLARAGEDLGRLLSEHRRHEDLASAAVASASDEPDAAAPATAEEEVVEEEHYRVVRVADGAKWLWTERQRPGVLPHEGFVLLDGLARSCLSAIELAELRPLALQATLAPARAGGHGAAPLPSLLTAFEYGAGVACPEHVDRGLLTLVVPRAGGLEVFDRKEKRWLRLKSDAAGRSVLVLAGATLDRALGHGGSARAAAVRHRIAAQSERRDSLVYRLRAAPCAELPGGETVEAFYERQNYVSVNRSLPPQQQPARTRLIAS
jgi:hypothetical protein